MEKSKLNICELAIQKTLSYSAVFKYPLSYYQICANLISKNKFSGKQIRKELKKQEKDGFITKYKGRYHLSSIKTVDWEERKKCTEKLIRNNRWVFEILEKIPWLKMISVTGSAANYNMEEKADIDLMFITSKNRLWLTRGFVFLILAILNKLPKEHKNRELCPNIFIDESSLGWIKKRRNLYVAQNIISMQPIFDKDEMYFRFMSANKWVKEYYHNFKINLPEKFTPVKSSKSMLMNLIEKLAMFLELKYMKRKMTTEIATEKLIHFNKNDNSRRILKSYKRTLKHVKYS
jgi:hypothetical protein